MVYRSCRHVFLAVLASLTATAPNVALALDLDANVDLDAPAPLREALAVPKVSVNCGGHYAETCHVCPAEYGEVWCHGDCTWSGSACVHKSFGVTIATLIGKGWWACILLWFVLGVPMGAYAFVYKKKVVDEFPHGIDVEDDDDWEDREVGLFAMFKETSTCLWAIFCTPVLAAKNYDAGGAGKFWPSCVLIFITLYSPFFCCAAVVRAVFSTKLQNNLKHKSSFLKEFIAGLFCFCCAVGRESLEVDDEENMEVRCPFKVRSTWVPPIVEEIVEEVKEDGRNCSNFASNYAPSWPESYAPSWPDTSRLKTLNPWGASDDPAAE